MLRHCVMFTWNDDVSAEDKQAIAAGLDQMAQLSCVHAYEHGADAGISSDNWDYVVVGDFASVDDYNQYATDADHVRLVTELIKPNISGRAAVQFELAN